MKFQENEKPHPADVATARALRRGEIVFDEDNTPWVVGNVEKYRRHNAETGFWTVPVRQAVYLSPKSDGSGHIVGDKLVCLRDYAEGEMIEIYDPADLVNVIERDMNKYVSRR